MGVFSDLMVEIALSHRHVETVDFFRKNEYSNPRPRNNISKYCIPVLLKVWSTVKIRGTRVPQKAIVPVGRPRPYSIIILNMRFIPKSSLKASSQITASSYIFERHL